MDHGHRTWLRQQVSVSDATVNIIHTVLVLPLVASASSIGNTVA